MLASTFHVVLAAPVISAAPIAREGRLSLMHRHTSDHEMQPVSDEPGAHVWLVGDEYGA